MPNDQQSNTGLFVPTTLIWDVQNLQSVNVNSNEFKELLIRLYQNINNIAISLNLKDTGYYATTEFLNSQQFFPNPALDPATTQQGQQYRQVFRMVIDFGALPNAGTKSAPHNIEIDPLIPTTYSFTRIYGAASNPDQTSFISLPYASPTSINSIQLDVTDTDIVITTGIDYSAYTISYVIVEYLKM